MTAARGKRPPMFRVRRSKIHGRGVFATRRIRKGTRIIEYVGERISHAEADRRHENRDPDDNHTFLFIVDGRTVIDAGVDGNDARWINHCCDPNCESVIDDRRVFIEAVRTIQPGEELSYDYEIKREKGDPPDVDEVFACRCGAATCRGTMLEERKPPRKRKSAKRPAKAGKGSKSGKQAARHAHGRTASRH
jgi:SET domain-containing protein